MNFIKMPIFDVIIIAPRVHGEERSLCVIML